MPPAKLELDDDPRVEFILQRLIDALSRGNGGIELTTIFDDGTTFLADFSHNFPGRKADPNYVMAKDRAYRLLARMAARGWVRDEIMSNYDVHPGEPKWVTEWKITGRGADYLRKLKNARS